MMGLMIALVGQAAVAVITVVNAHLLFGRDVVLKQWAVRTHDTNRDGWLTLYEAQGALAAFKELADGDRDGRVTTYEYARAKEFIAVRR